MNLELEGKVVIVTGASRGIGKAIATSLAAEGVNLVICARGKEKLDEAAEALREQGASVHAIALDITDPDAGERLVAEATSTFGGVDGLVGMLL